MLNTSARLIYNLHRYNSVTDALAGLHWLCIRECMQYKLAMLTYKVGLLKGSGPLYLGPLVCAADLPGQQALGSAGTSCLVMPNVRLLTVGSRAFAAAGPAVWKSLPEVVTVAGMLMAFRKQLKTYMFVKPYRSQL